MRSFKGNKKATNNKPTKEDTSATSSLTLPLPKLDSLHKNISWDELSPEDEIPEKSPNPRKRQMQKEDFENPNEFGGEFSDLFASLKADVTKTMSAKKKKFEGYAKSAGESAKKRIDDVYSKQEHERNKLTQEFINKVWDNYRTHL